MDSSITQLSGWDSERLGLPVAKIIPVHLDYAALHHSLETLRHAGIRLVYWAVSANDQTANQAAVQHGGMLVDHKVTYITTLEQIHARNFIVHGIETYHADYPDEDLFRLAFDSGLYSRFRKDPGLSETQFQAVYKAWMINSTRHLVAENVLIARNAQQRIIGMVTVGEKNQRGDIGLLAVAENARGQQLGTKLVQAAQHYFAHRGFTFSQVVTQQENLPACALYEKCGYHVEKVEHFYHFWL